MRARTHHDLPPTPWFSGHPQRPGGLNPRGWLRRETNIGFAHRQDEVKTAEDAYQKLKDKVLAELKKTFRPEFLNRIDGVVVFRQLNRGQIRSIVDLELIRIRGQLSEQQIKLEIGDEAKDFLAAKGWDPAFGARPLRRVIQNMVEDPLAEGLLQGRFRAGQTVIAVVEGDKLDLWAKELVGEPS